MTRSEAGNTPRKLHGLLILSCLVVVLWGAGAARTFLIPVCIAGLLAFLMAPVVRFLVGRKFPEWAAIGIATLVLFAPFLLVTYLLAHEVQSLVRDLPAIKQNLSLHLREFVGSAFGQSIHAEDYLNLSSLTERLEGGLGESFQLLIHGLRSLAEASSHLAIILLFAIVMLISREGLKDSIERLMAPYESSGHGGTVLPAVINLIERFLIARLLIVVIVFILAGIALTVFGLRYGVFLGAALGALTLIPAIGYFLGVTLTVILALATGHSLVSCLVMVGVLSVIGVFESHVLTPQLVGKRLKINMLTTFLGLFAGERLWGIWGMLLSVPILGILRIVLCATPALAAWGELMSEKEPQPAPSPRKPKKS